MIGDSAYWGQGYGSEAGDLLLRYAFLTLGLRKLNTSIYAFNKRSLGCALKQGFRREGVQKSQVYKNGKYHDVVLLGLFARSWKQAQGQ
jgi:RimJ/RimL family protein N-acetyltransferase